MSSVSASRPALLAYLAAFGGVAAVVWLTTALLPVLGLASAALLFLLPVLLAATRGGVGPGLAAALAGAAAYNYFLLEPRYTFRVHGPDNLVSMFVLAAVALVTSRLATRLLAREAEARHSAQASAEAAALAALLGDGEPQRALERGLADLSARHGAIMVIEAARLPERDAGLSSLDLAAAAWAIHNGDRTGHGTRIMPAADWSFLPLSPSTRHEDAIAAVARPADGHTRDERELDQLASLCLLLGQCRDRGLVDSARRERDLLEERDRLRRTFLASLAHDFRTPLTVISGRLELLASRDPEAREALEAARRLDRMMTDLIGAARIEAGSLRPAIESLDPVDAISAACDALAAVPDITLERAIAPDLPFMASDPVMLTHVLVNLIDNAQRHARSRVRITADRRPGADGTDLVRLAVEDDGPGIPESQRERIFERFTRLEGDDRTEGSGLGLAIVHGFAEAMGMTITVESSSLGGACFALSIPASPAPAA